MRSILASPLTINYEVVPMRFMQLVQRALVSAATAFLAVVLNGLAEVFTQEAAA